MLNSDSKLNNTTALRSRLPVMGCGCRICQNLRTDVQLSDTPYLESTDTGANYIDALVASTNLRWNNTRALGTPVNVTYSFMSSVPSYYPRNARERRRFSALNTTQRDGARRALQLWGEVSGLNFVEVSDTGNGGLIRFGSADFGSSISAFAYYPGNNTGGDIWLNNTYSENFNQTNGSYGFLTMIHEIGHAIGLKHPGNYNGDGGGTPGPYLSSAEDNRQYSVMSYNTHPNMLVDAQTPMLYDIAAIQYLYGADWATRTGNDTYIWQPNTATSQTIWDGNGIDTIDASNQTLPSKINLNPGSFSSIGPQFHGSSIAATNNIAIAFGVSLENARGGLGNDNIIGNNLSNQISGENGDDYLDGGLGNDNLGGGNGNDTLLGTQGNDTLTGGSGLDSFSFNTGNSFRNNNPGVNTIVDFTRGSDKLILSVETFPTINNIAEEFGVVNRDNNVARSSAEIVYNTANGRLFYNSNGSASGLGIGGQFAQLQGNPRIDASDFVISSQQEIILHNQESTGLLKYSNNNFQIATIQSGVDFADYNNKAVGDYNGDGRDDIFITEGDSTRLLTYNGTRFQIASVQTDWDLEECNSLLVGDFDNDGKDNIFVRSDELIALLTQNGSTFVASGTTSIDDVELDETAQEIVGDFDGDGKDDIFIRDSERAGLLTYNGSDFQKATEHSEQIGEWNLDEGDRELVGDFNGDDRDDIFIRNSDSAGLLTYNGSEFVSQSVSHDRMGFWSLTENDEHYIGDFNNDGRDDLFLRNGELVGLFTYSNGNFTALSFQFDRIGNWDLSFDDQLFVGDFNSDGKQELFIRGVDSAGLLTYNGSGFSSNSIQTEAIGSWNLTAGDQQLVGNFAIV